MFVEGGEGGEDEEEEISAGSVVTVKIKTHFIAPHGDEEEEEEKKHADTQNAGIVKVKVAPKKKEVDPNAVTMDEVMKDEELQKSLAEVRKTADGMNVRQRKKWLAQQEQSLISKARDKAQKKKDQERLEKEKTEAKAESVEEEQVVTSSHSAVDEKQPEKEEEEVDSDYDALDHQEEIREARKKQEEEERLKYEEELKAAKAADAKQRELCGPKYVHAPFFPEPHTESWFFVIGDESKNKLYGMAKGSCPTLSDEPNSSITMRMPAPKDAGTYHLTLYVMSDSYIGRDITQKLTMVVSPKKEIVISDEMYDPDLANLDDEDEDDDDDDDDDKDEEDEDSGDESD